MTSSARTRIRVLTPSGVGAIATLELVGPDAWSLIQTRFRPLRGSLPQQPELHRHWFGMLGEGVGDEVVIAVKSLDPPTIEIHCHGGPQVVRWLVKTFSHDAEFDSSVDANDPWHLLTKALTFRTAAILLDQCQGAKPTSPERFAQLANVGRHLVEPWRVVIAGPPNVGKSSLINALSGFQRSVVSPIAGTTRDVVTTLIALDGWPIELSDTAGLRETSDRLEALGVQRAEQTLAQADLVIWLLDATDPHAALPPAAVPCLLVVNKIDQPLACVIPETALRISATTGEGVAELCAAIVARLVPLAPAPGEAVPL